MAKFARSDHALAICDRCGLTYKLQELQEQIINREPSGLLVCRDCLDIDHEQLRIGEVDASDPMVLRHARPDNRGPSIGFFGWRPVGHTSIKITVSVGTVTVTTS